MGNSKRLTAIAVIAASAIMGSARAQGSWYYCGPTKAYYPYVPTCSEPWRQVAPFAYDQVQPAPTQRAEVRPAHQTPAETALSSTVTAAAQSEAYRQGQTDREVWEKWFNGLSGDYRVGAEYWAGHRSLPTPGSCATAPSDSGPDWSKGCFAAQGKLAPADVRRKTEPDYRLGWNNPTPSTIKEPEAVTPAIAGNEERKTIPGAMPTQEPAQSSTALHVSPASITASTQRPAVTQDMLVRIINDYATKYGNAANGMLQGAARPERRDAICTQFNSPQVTNWEGTVSTLSSNNDGDGVLAITIASNVTIKTWNNSFSDIGDHTLIPHGSRLFSGAAALHEGEKVVFSGTFVPDPTDCFHEGSLTVSGAMTDPEFLFRFSAIRPWLEDDDKSVTVH